MIVRIIFNKNNLGTADYLLLRLLMLRLCSPYATLGRNISNTLGKDNVWVVISFTILKMCFFNFLHEGKANFQNWIMQESDFKVIVVLRGNLAAELFQEGNIFERDGNFDLVKIFFISLFFFFK